MKKLISIAALMTAIASTAVADRTYSELYAQADLVTNKTEKASFAKSLTENEARAVLDYVLGIASTNVSLASQCFHYQTFPHFTGIKDVVFKYNPQLMPEYDAKFAAAGVGEHLIYYKNFPHMVEVWIADNPGTASKIPVAVAATRQHESFSKADWTFGERLNAFAEFSSVGFGAYSTSDNVKKSLLASAPKIIKRTLRLRGISFVVKPGEANPVQPPIDALSTALNAPKLAGLKEWVAEWCPSHDWVEPKWMTQAEATALKDAVFFGDVDLNAKNKVLLLGYYGIEEYNKFIAQYNGDAKPVEE